MKKQSVGFYMTVLTIILAVAGLIAYIVNCNTAYFSNLGINPGVVICLVIATVLLIAGIIASNKEKEGLLTDCIPVLCAVFLTVAFVMFLSARINSIATILSFERNAQTMADLSSAIVGMVLCLLAVILNIIASFFKMRKTETEA